MPEPPQRGRLQARIALEGMAAVGGAIGAGCLLAPAPVRRLFGVADDRRGTWLLRLFGVRELCLAYGMHREARSLDAESGRAMTELLAGWQAGDLVVTSVMAAGGGVSRRLAVLTWLGAAPTLAMALALRFGYFRR